MSSILPTSQEIETLHRKYAPTERLFDSVYTHCKIVCDITDQLILKGDFTVDVKLVRAASLLHDIGVYSLYDGDGNKREDYNYILHGIRGEEILKQERLPRELWRIASHHLAVGITLDDIKKQGLPLDKPYFPDTVEERLVTYADKFHSKKSPPKHPSHFLSFTAFKAYAATFDEVMATRFTQLGEEFGIPDLEVIAEKYGQEIKTI